MAVPDLSNARLTHVGLPCGDLERSIEFYTTLTPLVLVERFPGHDGETAWLSNDGQADTPFVLVLVCSNRYEGQPQPVLTPFAHIGIEVESRADVEAMAEHARELGVLHWEPRDIGAQAGYLCALRDPDGNVVEISTNQSVTTAVRKRFG